MARYTGLSISATPGQRQVFTSKAAAVAAVTGVLRGRGPSIPPPPILIEIPSAVQSWWLQFAVPWIKPTFVSDKELAALVVYRPQVYQFPTPWAAPVLPVTLAYGSMAVSLHGMDAPIGEAIPWFNFSTSIKVIKANPYKPIVGPISLLSAAPDELEETIEQLRGLLEVERAKRHLLNVEADDLLLGI